MFTGIVTDIGNVVELREADDMRARIGAPRGLPGLTLGASVACDGVCLTVIDLCPDGAWFDVSVSQETAARTAIGNWRQGSRLNLERSLRVGDELGGHIVTGHIDGVAAIREITTVGGSRSVRLCAPAELAKFIAVKGSVALGGVSLTVNGVEQAEFTVNLIPHTLAVTTWGSAAEGDSVNIEIDILARYMARFQEAAGAP